MIWVCKSDIDQMWPTTNDSGVNEENTVCDEDFLRLVIFLLWSIDKYSFLNKLNISGWSGYLQVVSLENRPVLRLSGYLCFRGFRVTGYSGIGFLGFRSYGSVRFFGFFEHPYKGGIKNQKYSTWCWFSLVGPFSTTKYFVFLILRRIPNNWTKKKSN